MAKAEKKDKTYEESLNLAIAHLKEAIRQDRNCRKQIRQRIIAAGVLSSNDTEELLRLTAEECLKPQIGHYYAGQGIYLGVCRIDQKWFPNTNIECEVYVSKKDLRHMVKRRKPMNLRETSNALDTMEDFDGHSGLSFRDEQDTFGFFKKRAEEALHNASRHKIVRGEWLTHPGLGYWFVPPQVLINGYAGSFFDVKLSNFDNLIHQIKFDAFPNTFLRGEHNYYWTNSYDEREKGYVVAKFDMPEISYAQEDEKHFCRPVRVSRVRFNDALRP